MFVKPNANDLFSGGTQLRGIVVHVVINAPSASPYINVRTTCRILSGARKYDHVTPILKDLRWLPVRQQLYYRNAILSFKCMTGSAPAYLSSQFIQRSDVSKRITRNSQMLDIPLFRSATGQRITFYYRTVKLWSSLDPELKLCESALKTLSDYYEETC
jgi:hypothetical protein